MNTNQLKLLLKNLQAQHDKLQAKNEQLTNNINDIRTVIKKVNDDGQQQLQHQRQKQKKLKNQIDRSKAALNVAHNNNYYQNMLAFKQ